MASRFSATDGRLKPAATVAAVFYLVHILGQGTIGLSETAIAATLAAFLWAVRRREIALSFHILYFPLVLYGVVSTFSAVVNHASTHLFFESATWLKMAIFPVALVLYRNLPHLRETALRAEIVFAVAIASYGIYQYFALGESDLEHRIKGPSTHVMTYSGMLMPIALLLVVLAVRRKRMWLFACAFIVSFALLLTLTRSVWLGYLVAIFTLLLLNRSTWILYAIPLLVVTVTFMPDALFGRLMSSFDIHQSSNLDRIRMAEAGVEIIKDHPVWGVGPANVKEVYPLYRRSDAPRFRIPHLHNNVIQLWAERGILGLASYVLLLGLFLRECARGWNGPGRDFAEAGVAITAGLAYAGLFEFNFGDTEVFLMMLGLFALVVASIEAASGEALPNEPPVRFVAPASV
ncbi:MAG TPA: O-antigen ligase family protein [Thermoanaerobaculia bacterium]|nr:O-antigen ligase family protein [Thermoanaerobaculia bacterium]